MAVEGVPGAGSAVGARKDFADVSLKEARFWWRYELYCSEYIPYAYHDGFGVWVYIATSHSSISE